MWRKGDVSSIASDFGGLDYIVLDIYINEKDFLMNIV